MVYKIVRLKNYVVLYFKIGIYKKYRKVQTSKFRLKESSKCTGRKEMVARCVMLRFSTAIGVMLHSSLPNRQDDGMDTNKLSFI